MLFRYCDIDTQGNKALVMKQYLSNEKVVIILSCIKQYLSNEKVVIFLILYEAVRFQRKGSHYSCPV
jgi:hypothetical protein